MSREVIVICGLLQLVAAILIFYFAQQHHRHVPAGRCGVVRADRQRAVADRRRRGRREAPGRGCSHAADFVQHRGCAGTSLPPDDNSGL